MSGCNSAGARARCQALSWPGDAAISRTKADDPLCAGHLVDVVRKPSSVPPRGRPRSGGGHSSRAAVTGRLEQPTHELGRVTLRGLLLQRETARSLMWPCSRWGLPCHLRYRRRGGLLPRRFTLSCRRRCLGGQVVSSLLHFPSRFRDRALPGIVLCGARTFLPSRFAPLGFRLAELVHGRRSPVRHRPRQPGTSARRPQFQIAEARSPIRRPRWAPAGARTRAHSRRAPP